MTVDEWDLRRAAKDLAHLYSELGEAMFAKAKPPEIQVMKPGFGPRPPAPDHIISLDAELSSRLFEMCRECCNHVSPTRILTKDGQRLSAFIAYHAQRISELDVAADLLEEMQDQIQQLKQKLQPRDIDRVANRPEPRHISGIIIDRLSHKGHKVTQAQLRQWVHRGHISNHPREDGRASYLMTEILSYLYSRNRGGDDGLKS